MEQEFGADKKICPATSSTFLWKSQGGRSQEPHFTDEMTAAGVGMITCWTLNIWGPIVTSNSHQPWVIDLGVTDLTFTRPFCPYRWLRGHPYLPGSDSSLGKQLHTYASPVLSTSWGEQNKWESDLTLQEGFYLWPWTLGTGTAMGHGQAILSAGVISKW